MRGWIHRHFGWLLCNYHWYRRWYGGHWELWCVDAPVCSDVWHDVGQCSLKRQRRPWDLDHGIDYLIAHWQEYTGRPTALCRGTPTCEDYPIHH